MTMSRKEAATIDPTEPGPLRELARIGAENAANAFSLLVDRSIDEADVALRDASEAVDPDWSSGVFFELEGGVDALVAVLFRAPACDAMAERLLGEKPDALAPWALESAFTEVANILASHVASGIAETLGERLLPSVPALALEDAAGQLDALCRLRGDRAALRAECELVDASAGTDTTGAIGGMIVLVPGVARR